MNNRFQVWIHVLSEVLLHSQTTRIHDIFQKEEGGVVSVVRKESRLRSSPASCVSLNLTLPTSWDHLDSTIPFPSQPSKVLLFHWWLWYFAAAFMQTKLDIFIKTSGRFPNPESVVTKHDHFLTLTRPLAQRWHNAELKCHFQHILGFAETYDANTWSGSHSNLDESLGAREVTGFMFPTATKPVSLE